MTEYRPRTFHSDAEVEHIGEGLLECALRREEWTHEAHLAATAYLLLRRPDVDLDAQVPDLIRRYNESVGGVNDDTQGYHETITRTFLHGVRLFLSEGGTVPPGTVPVAPRPLHEAGTIPKGTVPARSLHELVNALLRSPMGRRDWPLRFYSPALLVSVEARRTFVPPDGAALP